MRLFKIINRKSGWHAYQVLDDLSEPTVWQWSVDCKTFFPYNFYPNENGFLIKMLKTGEAKEITYLINLKEAFK